MIKFKSKKIILTVLSALLLVCASLFAACNEPNSEIVDRVENYGWSYEREFVDEHDADMTIDGVLNEARWQGKNYLTFTEKGITMSYTATFTRYGVYVGATMTGDKMVFRGRYNFAGFWQSTTTNSAFGFKIQGANVVEEHATTVFNFFVDSKNAASRNQTHFEAKATTNGTPSQTKSESTATAMTAELFVSWDALNIEIEEDKDYPDYVRIYPAYRYVESYQSANNRWLYPLFAEYGETRLLHRSRFNVNGYINVDKAGVTLGDAANGICKSDGWDLSALASNPTSGTVVSDTYHGQAIFYKGFQSQYYEYSTTVKITDVSWGLNGHAGVCDMIDSELFNAFYIDGTSVYNGTTKLKYHTLNFFRDGKTQSNWHDTNEGVFTVPTEVDPTAGIDIKVIRYNDTFYYFIYDALVLTKKIDKFSGKATCPGLYTLSRKAEFSNYGTAQDYTSNKSALSAKIAASAYTVTTSVSGTGTLESDLNALKKRNGVCIDDLPLTINAGNGYVLYDFSLTGVNLGGKTAYRYFLDNCDEGSLVIPAADITGNVSASATFKTFSQSGIPNASVKTVTGTIKYPDGNNATAIKVSVYNQNASLCYSTTTSNAGVYQFKLPISGNYTINGNSVSCNGQYTIHIDLFGYKSMSDAFTLSANATKNYELVKMDVGGSVQIGNKTVRSNEEGWDYSQETDDVKIVSTTLTPAGKAYFTGASSDGGYAIVETTVQNATDINADNYETQPHIGFIVDNGSHYMRFMITAQYAVILTDNNWDTIEKTNKSTYFNVNPGHTEEYRIRLIHFVSVKDETSYVLFQIYDDYEGQWITLCSKSDPQLACTCAYGLATTSKSGTVMNIVFSNYSINVDTSSDETSAKTIIDDMGLNDKKVVITYINGSVETVAVNNNKLGTPKNTTEFNRTSKDGFAVATYVNGVKADIRDANFSFTDYVGTINVKYDYDFESVEAKKINDKYVVQTTSISSYSYARIDSIVNASTGFVISVNATVNQVHWPLAGITLEDEYGRGLVITPHIFGMTYRYLPSATSTSGNQYNMKSITGLTPYGGHITNGIDNGTMALTVVFNSGKLYVYVNGAMVDTIDDVSNAWTYNDGTKTAGISSTGNYNVYLTAYSVADWRDGAGKTKTRTTDAPHVVFNSWSTSVGTDIEYNATFRYIDGTSEVIHGSYGTGLAKAPKKGYNYTTEGLFSVAATVNGNKVTADADFFKNMVADTEIVYSYDMRDMAYADEKVSTTGASSYPYAKLAQTVNATNGFIVSANITANQTYWPIAGIMLEDENGKALMVGAMVYGVAYRQFPRGSKSSEYSARREQHADLPYGSYTNGSIGNSSVSMSLMYKAGVLSVYLNGVLADTINDITQVIELDGGEQRGIQATGTYSVYLVAFGVADWRDSSNQPIARTTDKAHIVFDSWEVKDASDLSYTATIRYPDGSFENISGEYGVGLSKAPKYGYGYDKEGDFAVIAKVGGNVVTADEEFYRSLLQNTTVQYEYDANIMEVKSGRVQTTGEGHAYAKLYDQVDADEGFRISVQIEATQIYWPLAGITLEDATGKSLMISAYIYGAIYRTLPGAKSTYGERVSSLKTLSGSRSYGEIVGTNSIDNSGATKSICTLTVIYKDGALTIMVNGAIIDVITDVTKAVHYTENEVEKDAGISATGKYNVYLSAYSVQNWRDSGNNKIDRTTTAPHLVFKNWEFSTDTSLVNNMVFTNDSTKAATTGTGRYAYAKLAQTVNADEGFAISVNMTAEQIYWPLGGITLEDATGKGLMISAYLYGAMHRVVPNATSTIGERYSDLKTLSGSRSYGEVVGTNSIDNSGETKTTCTLTVIYKNGALTIMVNGAVIYVINDVTKAISYTENAETKYAGISASGNYNVYLSAYDVKDWRDGSNVALARTTDDPHITFNSWEFSTDTTIANNIVFTNDSTKAETTGTGRYAYAKLAQTVNTDEGFAISVNMTAEQIYWPLGGITLEDENGKGLMISAYLYGAMYRVLPNATSTLGERASGLKTLSGSNSYGTVVGTNSIDNSGETKKTCTLTVVYKDATLFVYVNNALVDRITDLSKVVSYTENAETKYAGISASGTYKVYLSAYDVKDWRDVSNVAMERTTDDPHITFNSFSVSTDTKVAYNMEFFTENEAEKVRTTTTTGNTSLAYADMDTTVSTTNGFTVSVNIATAQTHWPLAGIVLEDESGHGLVIGLQVWGIFYRYMPCATHTSGWQYEAKSAGTSYGGVTDNGIGNCTGVKLTVTYSEGTIYVYVNDVLKDSRSVTSAVNSNYGISASGNYRVYLVAMGVATWRDGSGNTKERTTDQPHFTFKEFAVTGAI